jgi:hypothetical protein
MTEAEWLACTDSTGMLSWGDFSLSERKLRLFALACCSFMRHLIRQESLKTALETVARYTEGTAAVSELATSHGVAQEVCEGLLHLGRDSTEREIAEWAASKAVVYATLPPPEDGESPKYPWNYAIYHVIGWEPAWSVYRAVSKRKWKRVAALLRDIAGNPFRPVTIILTWLTWNDGRAVKLAQGIYDEGAFDRLPILADALEDAGCTNADILDHCRQPGEHARGCWVVDLILSHCS